jgi:hypothetical protein
MYVTSSKDNLGEMDIVRFGLAMAIGNSMEMASGENIVIGFRVLHDVYDFRANCDTWLHGW